MPVIATWQPEHRQPFSFGPRVERREFRTEAELVELLRSRKLDGVAIELGERGIEAVELLISVAANGGFIPPVITDVRPGPLAFRQVSDLLRARLDVRVALRAAGSLEMMNEIQRLSIRSPQAREYVLRRIGPHVPRCLASIVLPALILGGDKLSARSLSVSTATCARTIRQRLALRGLPSPLKILGFVAGCHIAYDSEIGGLSISVSAQNRGFGSGDELRAYLKRRTRLTPTEWRSMGIIASLDLLAERLGIAACSSRLAESVEVRAESTLLGTGPSLQLALSR